MSEEAAVKLAKAVMSQNVDMVRDALKNVQDVDSEILRGLLLHAAIAGTVKGATKDSGFDVFKMLLDNPSFDPYVTDAAGNTILHKASLLDVNSDIAKLVRSRYPGLIDVPNNDGYFPDEVGKIQVEIDRYRKERYHLPQSPNHVVNPPESPPATNNPDQSDNPDTLMRLREITQDNRWQKVPGGFEITGLTEQEISMVISSLEKASLSGYGSLIDSLEENRFFLNNELAELLVKASIHDNESSLYQERNSAKNIGAMSYNISVANQYDPDGSILTDNTNLRAVFADAGYNVQELCDVETDLGNDEYCADKPATANTGSSSPTMG